MYHQLLFVGRMRLCPRTTTFTATFSGRVSVINHLFQSYLFNSQGQYDGFCCSNLNHPHTLSFWQRVSFIQICTRPYMLHMWLVQKRTQLTVWQRLVQLAQTIATEDEAPQQVFIGYNSNVWLWFSLSQCLSLSDTDDQQNCALRNLERSLSFMERNKTGPKTEAWENNLHIFILLRDCEALCWFCHKLFVWIASGCLF